MPKPSHKASVKRPRFNIDEQPKASGKFDIQKQVEYAISRKKETLDSKKVDWAKLRQVVINR